MKKLISAILLIGVIFCTAACTKKEEGTVPYKLAITCTEVNDSINDITYGIKEEKRDIVPKDGIILETEGKCAEGENVFDCVTALLQSEKIHFEGKDGYFSGIANIYAGDCGQFSGWMFFINGELASAGADDTVISANDEIEFRYVVDYNRLFD